MSYVQYSVPSLGAAMLGGSGSTSFQNGNYFNQTTPYVDEAAERKTKVYELEGLTRMYATLKEAAAPNDILASLEATIRRYTAELYYLETTK